jgi:hypothetical protein
MPETTQGDGWGLIQKPIRFRIDLGRIDARHSKSYAGDGMKGLLKLGLILGGYAAALLLTCAAFYVCGLLTRNDPSQASAGMQAFADLILFLGMFGVLALAPTALALYFLRPFEKFWTVFSPVSLAFAATGPVAAAMIQRNWAIIGILGLPRVLGAPLLGLGFLISAVIAPPRCSRWALLAAAAIEGAVSVYAFFCLFVMHHWLL